MSKTFLPAAPTADEKAMLQARVMELSHYVASTNGPWEQLFPDPRLATSTTICELKILEDQKTKDMRVLIYEAERPGGASTLRVLSNHLVHPETLIVPAPEDKGTLSLWVQDWLGTNEKECRETCLRLKFQAGAGLDMAFTLTYQTCQRQMEKTHEATKKVWKRGDLNEIAAAPALPPPSATARTPVAVAKPPPSSEEEEEEEEDEEDEEDDEQYEDEEEEDEDDDEDEYYDSQEEDEASSTPRSSPTRPPAQAATGLPTDILARLAQQDANKWKCPDCMVKNAESATMCASCEAPKPGTQPPPAAKTATPFSFAPKPPAGAAAPSATAFSFAGTSETAGSAAKPAFSFSGSGSSTGFSFSSSEKTTPSTTGLNFGAPSSKDAAPASPFVFPPAETKPGTSGLSFSSKPSEGSTATTASPFVFPAETKTSPAPAFGFPAAPSGTSPFVFASSPAPPPAVLVKPPPASNPAPATTTTTTTPAVKAPSSPVKLDFSGEKAATGPRFSLETTAEAAAAASPAAPVFPFASPKQKPAQVAPASNADFEARVLAFYTQYNPSKISEVPKLVSKYADKQDELFQKLLLKYPNSKVPTTTTPAPAAVAASPFAAAVASSPFAAAVASSPFGSAAAASPFNTATPKFGQTSGMMGLQPTQKSTPSLSQMLMAQSLGHSASSGTPQQSGSKTAFAALSETKQ